MARATARTQKIIFKKAGRELRVSPAYSQSSLMLFWFAFRFLDLPPLVHTRVVLPFTREQSRYGDVDDAGTDGFPAGVLLYLLRFRRSYLASPTPTALEEAFASIVFASTI